MLTILNAGKVGTNEQWQVVTEKGEVINTFRTEAEAIKCVEYATGTRSDGLTAKQADIMKTMYFGN